MRIPAIFCVMLLLFCRGAEGRAALPHDCVKADKHPNLNARVELFTQCLNSGSLSEYESAVVYTKRGRIHEYLGRSTLAIMDYDRALLINPKYYEAYIKRGTARYNNDEIQGAVEDFERAIDLRPYNKKAYNNLAWVLATTRDPRHRNGERALELVTKAVELSDIDDMNILDTLAAVYAELGQFDKAIEVQLQLISFAEESGDEKLREKFSEILADYQQKRTHY